jgi:hypothetical protein
LFEKLSEMKDRYISYVKENKQNTLKRVSMYFSWVNSINSVYFYLNAPNPLSTQLRNVLQHVRLNIKYMQEICVIDVYLMMFPLIAYFHF